MEVGAVLAKSGWGSKNRRRRQPRNLSSGSASTINPTNTVHNNDFLCRSGSESRAYSAFSSKPSAFTTIMAGGHMRYRHLGRSSSHRQALLRNLVTSLFTHESISTTYPKAKEAQRLAEKLITLGKKNTEASRRRALSIFYVCVVYSVSMKYNHWTLLSFSTRHRMICCQSSSERYENDMPPDLEDIHAFSVLSH